MFCPKCGKEIKEGAQFCQDCGTKVSITQLKDDKNTPKKEYKSFAVSKDTKLTGIAGWLALFILGVFVVAAWNIISTIVDFSSWGLIDMAIGFYGLYVGYLLVKAKPYAKRHTKIYLVIQFVLGLILLFIYFSDTYYYDYYAPEFSATAIRVIVYAIIWFLYFSLSKRVKNTYTS